MKPLEPKTYHTLLKALEAHDHPLAPLIESHSIFPDVVVELTCDVGLDDVLKAMATIPDSHVMQETVDFVELYTGERA